MRAPTSKSWQKVEQATRGGSISSTGEQGVVRRLYSDAASLGWASLTPLQRTRQYDAWLDDPDVGGVLQRELTRERARVWIKDGPMKEYARAVAGVGRYAKFIEGGGSQMEWVVSSAFGAPWAPVPASLRLKPLRCIAQSGSETRLLVWGPPRDFKHLLWAALEATDAPDGPQAVVAVVVPSGQGISPFDRERQRRLGHRCDVLVRHLQLP